MTLQLSKRPGHKEFAANVARDPRLRAESGMYLPLMVFGIVALLGMAGLALDAANMFYTKVQYQKAADVAAIASLQYKIRSGGTDESYLLAETFANDAELGKTVNYAENFGTNNLTVVEQAVIARARDVAINNLILNIPAFGTDGGDPITETDIAVAYHNNPNFVSAPYDRADDLEDEVVVVSVRKSRNYYLMNAVPFELIGGSRVPDTFTVANNADSRTRPANVFLMLDFSNSMTCPAKYNGDVGACTEARADLELWRNDDPNNQLSNVEQRNPGLFTRLDANCYCFCIIDGSCEQDEDKLKQLIIGVDIFLEKFRAGGDRISIIPFNLSSSIFVPITRKLNQQDQDFWDVSEGDGASRIIPDSGPRRDRYDAIRDMINRANGSTQIDGRSVDNRELSLGFWTNPSDALLTAYQHNLFFQSSSTTLNPPDINTTLGLGGIARDTYYVLFTDGSPTAGRFLLGRAAGGDCDLNELEEDLGDPNDSGFTKFFNQSITTNNNRLIGDVIMYTTTSSKYPTRTEYQLPGSINNAGDLNKNFALLDNGRLSSPVWKPGALLKAGRPSLSEYGQSATGTPIGDYYGDTGSNKYYGMTLAGLGDLEVGSNRLSRSTAPDKDNEFTYIDFMVNYCSRFSGARFNQCAKNMFDLRTPRRSGDNSHIYGAGNLCSDGSDYPYPHVTSAVRVFPEPLLNSAGNPDGTFKNPCRPDSAGMHPLDTANTIDGRPPLIIGSTIPSERNAGNYDDFCPQTNRFYTQEYIKNFYNAAVLYADLIRDSGGTIFTIGYGQQDTCQVGSGLDCSVATNDGRYNTAYQYYHDSLSIKNVFLARLANDPVSFYQPYKTAEESANRIPDDILDYLNQQDFPAEAQLPEWERLAEDTRGRFISANDPDELNQAFAEIAQLIVLLNK